MVADLDTQQLLGTSLKQKISTSHNVLYATGHHSQHLLVTSNNNNTNKLLTRSSDMLTRSTSIKTPLGDRLFTTASLQVWKMMPALLHLIDNYVYFRHSTLV